MRAIISLRLEREAGLSMIMKKRSKKDVFKTVFGVFLVMMSMVVGVFGTVLTSDTVYADPETSETTEDGNVTPENNDNTEGAGETENEEDEEKTPDNNVNKCKNDLGDMGWLGCSVTEKTASAVDWLYERIEGILVIKPVTMEDSSPIYQIWKYCLTLANIVFVIFLMVVIYSQLTGWGITNYGIKKALPKLIVVAILVNLSFLICSLAVGGTLCRK